MWARKRDEAVKIMLYIKSASAQSVVLRETPAAYSRVRLKREQIPSLPTVITGTAYI